MDLRFELHTSSYKQEWKHIVISFIIQLWGSIQGQVWCIAIKATELGITWLTYISFLFTFMWIDSRKSVLNFYELAIFTIVVFNFREVYESVISGFPAKNAYHWLQMISN